MNRLLNPVGSIPRGPDAVTAAKGWPTPILKLFYKKAHKSLFCCVKEGILALLQCSVFPWTDIHINNQFCMSQDLCVGV